MVINRGRIINFINGITGVAAGSQAVVNMPVNQRYHRNVFQCAAVNYTGGTGLAVTAITGSGIGATVTPTIVNGAVTAVTVVAGGSGWVVGNTFTFTDATGTGFVGTVATVTGGPPGALTTATVLVGGTPSPIDPRTMIVSLKQLVNGINMRDIGVEDILKISIANGYLPSLGELPLFYTAPWRNVNNFNEITSWDLFGQSTFQLQIGISPNVINPSLIGSQEFDNFRNTRMVGDKEVPFLQPTAQHSFTWPIVAGRNDINTLPFNFPISRMWLQGSTPGAISQVEVFQDGNKPFEATINQLRDMYAEYGFAFGNAAGTNVRPGFVDTQYAAGTAAIVGAYQEPIYYDAAFIADPDQRWDKALQCERQMILRVYSDVAQNLTIVQESMPGNYA